MSKFKKGIFKVMENNEEHKDSGHVCQHHLKKGFTDIESTDGSMRYKIGIIDFLTNYNSAKYLENQMKSKYHHVDQLQISAIH